jgi:hypothetical protein
MRGSGSLAFPAPSFTLAVAGRVFEVFPCARRRRPKAADVLPRRCSTVDGGFSPRRRGLRGRERPADHLGPWRSLLAPHAGAANPSRQCTSACRSVLHPATPPRLLLEVPSIDSPYRTSTPGCHVETRHLRPRGATRMGPVPPSWFLTTSTVSSVLTVRALLQPAADPGVHRVSRPSRLCRTPEEAAFSRCGRSPRCSHPSKMLPVRSACSLTTRPREVSGVSCSRSPLPPCRFG